MDMAAIIINLGILAATVVAAIVAWRSVKDARDARDAASSHAVSALAAATRSASAAESAALQQKRTADSLEKQTAILESASYLREEWTFEALGDASIDQRWKVTNNAGEDVTSVTIGTPDGVSEQWIARDTDHPVDIARGESTFFTFIRRLSSPTSRTIWIHWTPADGSSQKQFVKTIT